MDNCLQEWDEMEKEFQSLEELHKEYTKKVDEVKAAQKKCMSHISHQRYRIKQIMDSVNRLERTSASEDEEKLHNLKKQISHRKDQFRDMEETLPHENGVYLSIILGSVNISLLSKDDKFKYKEDYEKFKLYVTMLSFVFAVLLIFFEYRFTDAAYQFLLVWYYCTLTIREHILIVNGSRIKGWWLSHHFISTASAGILLIWPDGFTYSQFRQQFVYFSLYLTMVQILQYHYQQGCLYRLRALGERHNMDLTVEGFQSWMWKGLKFLLPFLMGGYIFQLYNAYVLFWLSRHEKCIEWQVIVLAISFVILGLGNFFTTFKVIRSKLRQRLKNLEFRVRNKYSDKKTHTA